MPLLQGDQVIAQVKNLFRQKRIATGLNLLEPSYIILTAYIEKDERNKIESQGDVQIFEKPLD